MPSTISSSARTGKAAALCLGFSLIVGMLVEDAVALAPDPQSNVRGFYDTLMNTNEERSKSWAEWPLCEAVRGGGQNIRCPVDDPTCNRLVLGDPPSGSAGAIDRSVSALYRGNLCEPVRQLLR